MRGDRPHSAIRSRSNQKATPHARGSTYLSWLTEEDGYGYPACAGIDPATSGEGGSPKWLPRMRGDRPGDVEGQVRLDQATPHARGSTRPSVRPKTAYLGYPACAGIDPDSVRREDTNPGLPRMRGDRPVYSQAVRSWILATPHARGSTSPTEGRTLPTPGYPACAGIDPRYKEGKAWRLRLPRMRGDRPHLAHTPYWFA